MIGNHITHIHARAFSEVPKLTEIVIRNNNIRSIDKRAFEGLGLLKKITLQENLSSVVKGVFHYFLNVTFLSMQVKKTHVPQKEICTLKQLQELTLEKFQFPSGKFLHCFADLTKLRVLTLNNMKLHSISGATFRPFRVSLEELHLNKCGLRILDVDTFKEFSKLIVLNLRRNAITHLPDTIFTSLTRLTFLDIALNKMKVFSDKLISPLRNLEYLDLGQYNNTMNLVLGKEFLNMTRLHRIYFYGNKISSLNNDTFRYLLPHQNSRFDFLQLKYNQQRGVPAALQSCVFDSFYEPFNQLSIARCIFWFERVITSHTCYFKGILVILFNSIIWKSGRQQNNDSSVQ